jgi:6-phosphogluconolactonase (cycloisomerase 2 family)
MVDFAYVSNRNIVSYAGDNLAILALNTSPNKSGNYLTYLGSNLTYGKIPRQLLLSNHPQCRYAAVGNEVSTTIVILRRAKNYRILYGLARKYQCA